MQLFDAKVPPSLKELQMWFGESLVHSPHLLEIEKHILGNRYLSPQKRFEIYQTQVWGRLLHTLRDVCPLVSIFMGKKTFDELLGRPFLGSILPRHWSLDYIGEDFPEWILENYQGEDRQRIFDMARIDTSYIRCLLAAHFRLQANEPTIDFFEKIFYLQPHVHLFSFDYDLFAFRENVLEKEVSYWQRHAFPSIEKGKQRYFILYRDRANYAVHQELSAATFYLLKQFEQGSSFSQVLEWLENQEASVVEETEKHLQIWIQEWVGKEWICKANIS